MTISQLTDQTARDDADLVRAAAGGDRAAFAAIYDRYANRLHDFCIGMLRDRDAAADCIQDVFLTAATRLVQLREPERLRSWLYAIARNEALARIQQRHREQLVEDVPEIHCSEPDLDTLAARSELARLINDACGGLSDRDRTVFELAYRHGLDGPELADALGVSHTNANTMLGRLRDTIERSLGALLVSRRAKAMPNSCPELVAMLEDWDGRFTVLMRKRVARHIDSCLTCDAERRRMVNPVTLLGGAPAFLPTPAWLREETLSQFPSAVSHAAAPASASSTYAAGAHQSWWPPQNFDTSDLGRPGSAPLQTGHPGGFSKTVSPVQQVGPTGPAVPANGLGATAPAQYGGPAQYLSPDKTVGPATPAVPTKQVGPPPRQPDDAPTVGATKPSPLLLRAPDAPGAGPNTLNTDSGHDRLGGRARTPLLVALVLLAFGTVAVLGSVLLRQIWPSTGPSRTPTPAPAATSAPVTTRAPAPAPIAPPQTMSVPAPAPAPVPTQDWPPIVTPNTGSAPNPTSVRSVPAAPPLTADTSTPAPSTSQPPPPPPQIPDSDTGSSPGSNSGGSSGVSGGSNAGSAPSGGSTSGSGTGGSSSGSRTGGSSSGGGSGGSVPSQKVAPGSGPYVPACLVVAHCATTPTPSPIK